MKTQRSHKIRLCPNDKQRGYFSRACGCARFTYNWALQEWKRQYESGEKPSPFSLKKKFNSIKRQQFPFVTKVTKCAVEQPFIDLGRAFKNFFRNIKAGKKPGYPRFKKKGIKDSFYIANDRIQFNGKKVKIPKLGWVKMRESLRFEGKILSTTISSIAGMWFISVQVEEEVSIPKPTKIAIGVDVGIKTLATVSDGRVFENPKALKSAENKLRCCQKSVSRKKKGSKNRKKAVLRLQRQHYRISNIRKDSIHKLTTAITKSCGVLGIEDLNVKGMLKNHKLARALSDASLSETHRQLEYKSKWFGVEVFKADRFYPSSKTCSKCGNIKSDLTLSDREYHCGVCGLIIDRDLNASINLESVAVGSTVLACRLGSSGLSAMQINETTDWAGISLKSA